VPLAGAGFSARATLVDAVEVLVAAAAG